MPKWHSSSFTSQAGSPARVSATTTRDRDAAAWLVPHGPEEAGDVLPSAVISVPRSLWGPALQQVRTPVTIVQTRENTNLKQHNMWHSQKIWSTPSRERVAKRRWKDWLWKDSYSVWFFFIEKASNFENKMFFYLIKGRIIQNTWGLSHLFFWPTFFQAKKGRNRNTKLKWASTRFHHFLLLFLKRFQ